MRATAPSRKIAGEERSEASPEYDELRRLSAEREALLNINRAIGRHLDPDELFGALASCLHSVMPAERFGIELPVEGNRLKGHILTPQSGLTQPTQITYLPAQGTACDWVLQNRDWVVVGTREELRDRFPVTFRVMTGQQMESLCALPLVTRGHSRGALFFMNSRAGTYHDLSRSLLDQVASAVAIALDNCLAHEEVRRLRDRLAAENAYLREEIRSEHNFAEIIGDSAVLLQSLRKIEQVASTDSTVLLLGETGTGKELFARAIHELSRRKTRPLVKVNCGAISAGLVESELFGHVKGAFTGALATRDGRFKVADGGTIFLDEVGELPLETQVKLLRVLQEQEFEPIGSSRTVKVDVRIIAATNRDLSAAVAEGRFRRDLYYRLNVFPIHVPPLRERIADVPLLVSFFLQRFAKKLGKPVKKVSEETVRSLTGYPWPGNIRELQNVIERAILLSPGETLVLAPDFGPAPENYNGRREEMPAGVRNPKSEIRNRETLATTPATDGDGGASLENIERRHIESVLSQTNWMIEGERGAARVLNLNPSTLRSRMQKLGIKRPSKVSQL